MYDAFDTELVSLEETSIDHYIPVPAECPMRELLAIIAHRMSKADPRLSEIIVLETSNRVIRETFWRRNADLFNPEIPE